ncbi:MAG: transglutaminase-like domain-containing protein [Thermoplasmatota archaeon]
MKRRYITVIVLFLIIVSAVPLAFWMLNKPDIDDYERTRLKFTLTVVVDNLGNAPATNIPLRLGLPVDVGDHQKVIDVRTSVIPERTTNDTFGNRFIHYTIEELGPGGSFNVSIDMTIELVSIDTNIMSASNGVHEEDLDRYLLASALINVNEPAVIDVARQIADRSDDIREIAWNTYEWIIENIYYQQIAGELDAATTLRNGEGGSAEMANLFVALMRANGIPARRISGWGNVFEEGEELVISRFSHGWAEFYVDDVGWVQVDPAWGRTSKFDNFARTDDDHVILTIGAGVKYLWRGPYSTPFGDTNIDTDYTLTVRERHVENLSVRRDAIKWSILSIPLIFVAFIIVQLVRRRRV